MKKLITLLAILLGSVLYSQNPDGMVLIPNYDTTYVIENRREFDINKVYQDRQVLRSTYIQNSNDVFIRGNFNQISIIYVLNDIDLPKCNTDNNKFEYIKTTQFNPQKRLQKILRDNK